MMRIPSDRRSWRAGAASAAALLLLALSGLPAETRAATPPAVHEQAPPAPSPAAAAGSAAPAAPGAQAAHTLTRSDAAAFFDGMIPYAIERANIAGAVVAVVDNGQVLFEKGYGFSDVKTRARVSARRTLFRAGSISKLMTWTAVMQLVQAGKINLDADVNDYLDFRIPPKFGRPITMRDLMTHTAGFEDTISKMFVPSPRKLIPLRDYLIAHLPARIYPPGRIVAYSNYGATLAGYIVQRLSGEPFDQYVEKHIFQPLGMRHSTFVQPLPPSLAAQMSHGYARASDQKSQPFELIEIAPAGALSTTAADMARFMIAQLGDGSDGGAPILDPQTLALMHSTQSQMAPGMNGFDLGFYQENRNGLDIIAHAGDTDWFHSDLHLILGHGVGLFLSFNSAGHDGATEAMRVRIFRAFLDRYFPYTPPQERTVADPRADAARVAGWYISSRRITSALSFLGAFDGSSVTALPDGTIELSALTNLSGTPKRWREVGPLTYRVVGGQSHLKFVTDRAGHIRYWISDDLIPVMVFLRTHGLERESALEWMIGAFCAVLLLTLILWAGGRIVRRHFGAALVLPPRQQRLRLASRIGAALLLAMIGAWVWIVVLVINSDWSIDGPMIVAYCVSVLGLLGAVAILAESAQRIWRGPGGWLVRSGEAVLALAALYGIWLIFAFGLINFSLRY
jgi:CubicO group peptidase (beta-lactamase class C family)